MTIGVICEAAHEAVGEVVVTLMPTCSSFRKRQDEVVVLCSQSTMACDIIPPNRDVWNSLISA